jgi:hypothetical protein
MTRSLGPTLTSGPGGTLGVDILSMNVEGRANSVKKLFKNASYAVPFVIAGLRWHAEICTGS